ncbi:hypothetical protein HHI36_024247 [Cryptolaemus montrouzieri]|uniref:Uncharacterized protein n=1 Tax=Cryptolaemus montrouzieri TaxID=559131 RepID=A0ABD2NCV3_9CUCU
MSNENISNFSNELKNKNECIQAELLNSEANEFAGQKIAIQRTALRRFIFHCRPEISQMLRARDIKTLNEAYDLALQEEKILNYVKPHKSTNLYCSICKMTNHPTQNCKKKNIQTQIKILIQVQARKQMIPRNQNISALSFEEFIQNKYRFIRYNSTIIVSTKRNNYAKSTRCLRKEIRLDGYDGILGTDFMKDHHSVIDYNNNTIKIDHIILPFKDHYIQNNIEYANKIILSARSETIAEVKLSNCLPLGIIINQEIQKDVLIPNTLVNNNNQKAYIPILNLSHNEIIIDKPTFELAEIIPEEIVNLTQVQPTKRGTLLNNNLRLNHLSKEE